MTRTKPDKLTGGVFDGLRVVEFAHVIAGPLAGTLLADLGADVIHVEDPVNGDPARKMGPQREGTYLWWKVAARNKRSVTLDLRVPDGQRVARDLVVWADVVITNFRVGTLEEWGLDWSTLRKTNPRLVMLQISGHGTDTTLRNEPGFGKVGEAESGVVHLTGFADGPPVHTGFSHGDSVTALMGAFAVSAALNRRHDDDFAGEWIDLALFESLFRLIEWQVIVHDQLGIVPARTGNRLAVAPAAVVNTYACEDGDWVTVTSGTPKSVRNIAQLLGYFVGDFMTVEDQRQNRELLDSGLRDWISERDAATCLEEMRVAGVVASRVYSIADIMKDETYRERNDIIEIDDADLGSVRMQGVIPKFHNHPGRVWRTGPRLGQDNEFVYGQLLGMDRKRLEELQRNGVI